MKNTNFRELNSQEMKVINGGNNIFIDTILTWLGIERDLESVT